MKDFKDKVVVITGGATGIGFGFAKAFGLEGAKLVLSARRENRLQDAVSKLNELGIEASYFCADVTKVDQVEALADFAWKKHCHVDVIINNAGMMTNHSPMLVMPSEDLHNIFNVNFFGVVLGSQVFGKRFLEQGTPAAIYNVGSENSLFHGTPLNGAYVATKHSVMAITESLKEETPDFIDVSLICPGFVMSELGPEENMKHGMPTDEYVKIAMTQLKNNEFYVVSHAYNSERIAIRYNKLKKALDTYAPRYEGDIGYDVRTVVKPILEEQLKIKLREV